MYDLYAELLAANKHPSRLDNFRFPRKSIFNTFSAHTLERRRSGFRDFLRLLFQAVQNGESVPGLAQLLDLPPEALQVNKPRSAQRETTFAFLNNDEAQPRCRSGTGSRDPVDFGGSVPSTSSSSPSPGNHRERLDMPTSAASTASLKRSTKHSTQINGRGIVGNLVRVFLTFLSVTSGYLVSASRGWVDYSHLSIARICVVLAVLTMAIVASVEFLFAARRKPKLKNGGSYQGVSLGQ